MKTVKYIISTFVLCCLFLPLAAQNNEESALEAYRAEDYKKSIELYEQIVGQALSSNQESAEIYYNLANAYFRNGQTAKAILNYERALLIKPADKDIRHNLRFARTRIEDKIDSVDSFFLTNWINGLQNAFTSNAWTWIGIVLFICMLYCVAAFLFGRILWVKKTAFYAGIVLIVLVFTANVFAFRQKNKLVERDYAIVMAAAASVHAEPKTSSNELFQLHEGTKVKVRSTDSNWCEIEIANGSVGWTTKDNIEVI